MRYEGTWDYIQGTYVFWRNLNYLWMIVNFMFKLFISGDRVITELFQILGVAELGIDED